MHERYAHKAAIGSLLGVEKVSEMRIHSKPEGLERTDAQHVAF